MREIITGNPLAALIAAAEVWFWVLLGSGLVARYLFRLRRVSLALLTSLPLLDTVLVTATVTDVARGRQPQTIHGLAGVYLGLTVAFGPPTIRWADARFAHRFDGGPPPGAANRYGRARVRQEWLAWGRVILAWAVSLAVILLTSLVAGSGVPALTSWPADPLWSMGLQLGRVALVWLVVGPLWVTLSPPRAPMPDDRASPAPSDAGSTTTPGPAPSRTAGVPRERSRQPATSDVDDRPGSAGARTPYRFQSWSR